MARQQVPGSKKFASIGILFTEDEMLTLIGDVHGRYDDYLDLIEDVKGHSLQLGDFGFKYDCLKHVDPERHRLFGGNHDNYDVLPRVLNDLGDFGMRSLGGVDFYFLRGENSVDRWSRTEGVSWWRAEELSMSQGYAAVEDYAAHKPEIMVSHGCPEGVMPIFLTNPAKQISPSRTSQILQAMLEAHRPKMWVFGHHHNDRSFDEGGCRFVCLNELSAMTLD
jgi:hypothetical protein